MLVANNLRDIPGDAVTGKRTLAVRLGDRGTRGLYAALLLPSRSSLVVVAAFAHVTGPAGAAGVLARPAPAEGACLAGARGPRASSPSSPAPDASSWSTPSLLTLGFALSRVIG